MKLNQPQPGLTMAIATVINNITLATRQLNKNVWSVALTIGFTRSLTGGVIGNVIVNKGRNMTPLVTKNVGMAVIGATPWQAITPTVNIRCNVPVVDISTIM